MAGPNTILDLYELLPAFYRIDDAQRGYPLRAVMDLVNQQAELIRQDIAGLWDDFFVETCADWVIPYIGDLVSNRAFHEAVRGRRADVAKTIYYRRRKGTLPMLEELARDVTGWGAHAVAFFEMLGWTQNLNHFRLRPAPNPDGDNPNAWDRVGTAHIRNLDAMDLLDHAFDITTHTVDVRPITRLQGWYNIRKIGFFLWRLVSFLMARSDPRQSVVAAYGYHFSPLGNPTPLFTLPDPVLSDSGLSDEFHVPGPIRALAFHEDLDAYQREAAARGYLNLPPSSRFFGFDRSLDIVRGGVSTSPLDVACADLRNWERPPAGFSGLFSGNLAAFPGLSAAAPQLNVTVGNEGTHIASVTGAPVNPAQAAAALQSAIRNAAPSLGFAGTRVILVGTELLIMPGTRGAVLSFAATAADATTVNELGLNAAATRAAQGVLSGDLTAFPALLAAAPQVLVTIGGNGPHMAALAAVPVTLAAAAAALQTAIQGADGAAAFTGALVQVVENRLLVLPGVAGQTVLIRRTAADPATAEQLKLSPKIGVDVRLGRFAFAIGDEPANPPVVRYTYGFSDSLGGGPYDRRQQRQRLGQSPAERPDTVRDPGALGLLLEVSATGFNTIGAALAAWNPAANPSAVIQIDDSRSYSENLNVNLGASAELIIQAENHQRPALLGNITVTAVGGNGRFRVDGLWIEGQTLIRGSVGELRLAHCTLVPGLHVDEQGAADFPDSPSLVIDATNNELRCLIDHCICGSLVVPEEILELDVNDSIVDTSRAQGRATGVPAWISGDLTVFPALTSATPTVLATIGDDGPFVLTLGAVPPNLATAATLLQTALRAAATTAGFTGARVLVVEGHLVVIPGADWPIFLETRPGDNTAVELKLDSAQARSVRGLRSGPLAPLPPITAALPSLSVVAGALGPRVAQFVAKPADLAGAGTQLENALRAADPAPEFANAIVAVDGATLLVFPGGNHTGIVFVHRPQDLTTLFELQLESVRPSLAATLAGEAPGPNTMLSRVTVFGPAHVRELILATETIFAGRVIADRRQAGCVRFSYVAPTSRTPRRYRCQPDLALEGVTDASQKALIQLRLRPSFTSIHYGDPGYAQLSLNAPCAIKTGAENGSEMGAFSELMQPQREANLRLRLDEYLPFGLEPGLIYVT